MKKVLIMYSVILLGLCSSCTSTKPDTNHKVVETIDYKVAYENYSKEFVELNDINLIKEDEQSSKVIFYYKDSQGYLVPVMRQVPKQEGIAKSVIEALIDDGENRIELRGLGLSPVLPKGLKCELALKGDNLMRVSFNDVILSLKSEEEEKTALQAVIYTLTEFETVDKVQILVNNEIRDTLTNGTKIKEPLTRANINAVNNVVKGEFVKSTFYSFNNTSNNYTYYIPITKNILKDHKDVPSIIEEQINLNREMNKKIPDGFELDSVVKEDKTVYLSIKKEIDTENINFIRFMNAMCLTIGQNSDVDTIKLLIGDKEVKDKKIETFTIPTFANVYK